jgi:hypothetical protein
MTQTADNNIQKLPEESLKIAAQLQEDAQSFISGLLDVESVIVGIVGASENPLSIGHIRKEFTAEIALNMNYNVGLYFGVSMMRRPRGKTLIDLVNSNARGFNHIKLIQELNSAFDKVNKEIKSTGFSPLSPSKIKLIPNYEFFAKVVEEFLVAKGIFQYRPSVYENADFLYYVAPNISTSWNSNRAKLLKEINANPYQNFNTKNLSFYHLTNDLLDKLSFKDKITDEKSLRKALEPHHQVRPVNDIICLTEIEYKFLREMLFG